MVIKRKTVKRKKKAVKGVKKSVSRKKVNKKEILAKAAVDPAFRSKLFRNPEYVFQGKLTAKDKEAVNRLRKTLPALDGLINSLSGEILCGTGGCGGLA
jgi:hypothetical protein